MEGIAQLSIPAFRFVGQSQMLLPFSFHHSVFPLEFLGFFFYLKLYIFTCLEKSCVTLYS